MTRPKAQLQRWRWLPKRSSLQEQIDELSRENLSLKAELAERRRAEEEKLAATDREMEKLKKQHELVCEELHWAKEQAMGWLGPRMPYFANGKVARGRPSHRQEVTVQKMPRPRSSSPCFDYDWQLVRSVSVENEEESVASASQEIRNLIEREEAAKAWAVEKQQLQEKLAARDQEMEKLEKQHELVCEELHWAKEQAARKRLCGREAVGEGLLTGWE
eukprot:s2122_g16.t1